jgi:hypothetical protein
MAFLREKNRCPGCRRLDDNIPVSIARCKIRNCAIFQDSKATYCYECDNYPCASLKHLDKRYRTKYRMSMMENLENIREFGIARFLGEEKRRWACPQCGGIICVHKGYCFNCRKIKDKGEIGR